MKLIQEKKRSQETQLFGELSTYMDNIEKHNKRMNEINVIIEERNNLKDESEEFNIKKTPGTPRQSKDKKIIGSPHVDSKALTRNFDGVDKLASNDDSKAMKERHNSLK